MIHPRQLGCSAVCSRSKHRFHVSEASPDYLYGLHFGYTDNPDDSEQLSFDTGEVMDVLDTDIGPWSARTVNGVTGGRIPYTS
jgi:hypothetical protein